MALGLHCLLKLKGVMRVEPMSLLGGWRRHGREREPPHGHEVALPTCPVATACQDPETSRGGGARRTKQAPPRSPPPLPGSFAGLDKGKGRGWLRRLDGDFLSTPADVDRPPSGCDDKLDAGGNKCSGAVVGTVVNLRAACLRHVAGQRLLPPVLTD